MTQEATQVEDTKKVLDAIDRFQSQLIEMTLANGIVLELVAFPHEILRRAMRVIERPKPPLVEINGEQEENPADPDYLQSIDEYDERRMACVIDVLRAKGTRVKTVPEGMQRPEDDGWIEDARIFGVEPDVSSPTRRYLEWLNLYAIDRTYDGVNLQAALLMKYGILESEVAEAIESFRNRAQRRAFDFLSATAAGVDGDTVQK